MTYHDPALLLLLQGMGVLMVGRTEAAASAAVLALQKALPAGCHGCFLAFKVHVPQSQLGAHSALHPAHLSSSVPLRQQHFLLTCAPPSSQGSAAHEGACCKSFQESSHCPATMESRFEAGSSPIECCVCCKGVMCWLQAGQAAHASPDAAGAVQKELAAFLKRCPGGVVALDNAQKLHPALLPVFINALSEQGSFEVPFTAWACSICRHPLGYTLQPRSLTERLLSLNAVSHLLVCLLLLLSAQPPMVGGQKL